MLQGRLVQAADGALGQAERARQLQQALLLAPERHAGRSGGEEQRLDAERVAGAEQHPLLGVPDEEREHPAQPGHRGRAPVVVGGDDRLGVALGRERRPVLAGQLLAQLEVVVDLAVEHDRVAAVGVRGPASGWCECSTSMIDSRLKPNTTSASCHVPLSSGPRCRAQRSASPTGPARRSASAPEVNSPRSPHTVTEYAERVRHDGAPHPGGE